jgi:hypothetical protein
MYAGKIPSLCPCEDAAGHEGAPGAVQPGKHWRKGDHAYLAEGWGDILLVLTGSAKDRLHHLFTIQGELFGNLLVDRTEIFLPTPALDGLLEQRDLLKTYSLFQTVRCAENSGIQDGEAMLLAKLRDPKVGGIAQISATPGRQDYALIYDLEKLAKVRSDRPDGREIIDILNEMLDPAMPDEIITTIARNIE